MVAVGRRLEAKAKKLKRSNARDRVGFCHTRGNPEPVVRGPYRGWDEYAMECALSELAECADHKNAHLHLNIAKTAEKWGIPRKTLARYFHTPGYFDFQIDNRRILTNEEEEEIVQCILDQHAAGMALTDMK
jgi:hypothetical protein